LESDYVIQITYNVIY